MSVSIKDVSCQGTHVLQALGAMRAFISGVVNELLLGRKKSDLKTDSGYACLRLEGLGFS